MQNGWSDEKISFYFDYVHPNVIRKLRTHSYYPDVSLNFFYNPILTTEEKIDSCYETYKELQAEDCGSGESPHAFLQDVCNIENITEEQARMWLPF